MSTTIIPLSQLPLSDDFMFGKVGNAAARGMPAFFGVSAGKGHCPH